MTDRPTPLTPPDCDLRDFSKIMIDVTRLFASTFNAKASRDPLAWMIGHKLWYRSWHQVPAASLPNDEDELCYLAELGFDVKSFRKARALAMHGWIECSDGRLYHPVVAEAARVAWESKLRRRHGTECARIKKHNQRHGTNLVSPDFDSFVASGCRPVDLAVPRDDALKSPVCPRGQPEVSPGTNSNVPRETPSKGEGEGKGYKISKSPSDSSISDPDRPPPVSLPAIIHRPDEVQQAFERHDVLRREFVSNARNVDLTPARRLQLAARLKELGGIAGWEEVLAIIRGSPFLRGDASRNGFVPLIDWLLKPANLRKVREGNYDDDDHNHHSGSASSGAARSSRSPVDAVSRALDALGAGG